MLFYFVNLDLLGAKVEVSVTFRAHFLVILHAERGIRTALYAPIDQVRWNGSISRSRYLY
jgi:hypothetical protein